MRFTFAPERLSKSLTAYLMYFILSATSESKFLGLPVIESLGVGGDPFAEVSNPEAFMGAGKYSLPLNHIDVFIDFKLL